MAKKQNKAPQKKASQNISNIIKEYNVARLGLDMDSSEAQIIKGKLSYALNAVVENFDSNSINYQNEPGNIYCLDFPKDYLLIGNYFINEQYKHIFWLTNPLTGGCQIGYMVNNDCVYHTLVSDPCLGFSVNFPIHSAVHRITNCTTEVYWADNVARRYMDIDNVPYKLLSGTALCDPVYSTTLDCNQLKVQPDFSIPNLSIKEKIQTGGNLLSGTYQFTIQYSDASGSPLTSYYSVTNPCPINDPFTVSVNFNTPVGKSIIVTIDNLDLSGQFGYFNLVVIKTINDITSSESVGVYSITGSSRDITYTGQNQQAIQVSMQEIFEKFPYYDQADDVTAVRDILVWKGLATIDRINYQAIWSKVKLQWESYRIPADEDYSDELNATNLKGYLRDETYPIEGVFLLANGRQTDKFHIPGRTLTPYESTLPEINTNMDDFVGPPSRYVGSIGYSPYWKIYNTASVTGPSPEQESFPSYKGPWEYGEFAYTESSETYPCNEDVWGDLAGQPIRHHKFPDVLVSPIDESTVFSSPDNMVMQNNAIFPIGIRLDMGQIRNLINLSNLTQEQKDEIVGVKIVRGNRGTNKSVLAKGILRNVNKYKRGEQEFYFPNYPYNDLNEDPFLNETNNAWTQQCNEYDIVVKNIPVQPEADENGTFNYVEYEYYDCDTNKLRTKKLYRQYGTQGPVGEPIPDNYAPQISTGPYGVCDSIPGEPILTPFWNDDNNSPSFRQCSIGKPRWISAGSEGNEFDYDYMNNTDPTDGPIRIIRGCTPFDYCNDAWARIRIVDVWRVEWRVTNGSGVRITWNDPTSGARQVWLKVNENMDIVVPQGEAPVCVEGCTRTRLGYKKRKVNIIFKKSINPDAPCGIETPLTWDNADGYRQIFNSPETSFGQPFLGATLKLESTLFGKGNAHSVEVKKNAKYKLLTEEAQRDALESADNIGRITSEFNATAMFAAYSAYLEIYTNGITRKSYAQSYNSIASYNYNEPVPNDLGIKQRPMDVFRYLIPGVQAIGEAIPVNNYERESSVFLKTKGTLDGQNNFPSALPFPTTSVGVTDESRETIKGPEGCDSCDTCFIPTEVKDISVVSYYASIKNLIPNQWGQIYSYTTVDTGFQESLSSGNRHVRIFGGDTFINKFAFKTKLPFFIDNRVNAPDDSDIFFDEIGNVAYPKYWHSARSITKTVSAGNTSLTNFISYKAHNFDCPNSQELTPADADPDSNPGRTYYDGYYYLFAYGVPSFYCESSYNTDLRQAFNNKEGEYWPHVSTFIPDDSVQEDFVSIANDNTYYYNITYSKQNQENSFTSLPPDWTDKFCYTYFPFRAIYSDIQSDDQSNQVNNWLIYRAVSYFDFPQNFGKFVSIDGIQDKAILARFENKTLLYNSLLTMDTSNPQAAYIGNSQLFRGAPPVDFADTDLGFVGTQNKMLLKIPNGQVTIDAKRGHIFLLQGQTPTMLSKVGSGMNSFLKEHLSFQMLKYFPETRQLIGDETIVIPGVNVDNHFNGVGLHGVFDNRFDRIIISKLDYIPLDDNIVLDPYTQEFSLNGIKVELTDPQYFCNKSWTLSFNLNTNSWISFHSYIPNYYIAENNHFYSGTNDCCSEFDFVAGTIVATPTTTTTTTIYVPRCTPFEGTAVEVFMRDCDPLEGTAVFTDCTLSGTGQILIP
jgi:hypothetical protein